MAIPAVAADVPRSCLRCDEAPRCATEGAHRSPTRREGLGQAARACRPRRQPTAQCRAVAGFFLLLLSQAATGAAQSIDGGRSELPGMKRDVFDQYQANKGKPQQAKSKASPPCPKSDFMSPFTGITFSSSEMYVRLNGTEGKCTRLLTVGGFNFTNMVNFSRTCGPPGEWKRRIAENLSTIFFQGGAETWAKHDGEAIEVITEEGTFEVEVTEAKYAEMVECWKRGCGCEQANHPMMKMLFITAGVIAIGGLGYDSAKAAKDKIFGKKPPKHVLSKAGHRMKKVTLSKMHYCDVCGSTIRGVAYQCSGGTDYHMTKKCYDEAKAKVKENWKKWCEDHPEDKKSKKDEDEDEKGDGEEANKSEAESEPKSKTSNSEADDGKGDKSEGDKSEAETEGGADETEEKGEDDKKEE